MSAEVEGTPVQSPAPIVEPHENNHRWKLLSKMSGNPVVLKELRGRMRGRQAFVLLTLYLGLISLFIGVIYAVMVRQSSYVGWDPSFRQEVGKAVFGSVVLLEFLMLGFIGPGLTSGAVSGERERQTFDLLRTTLLSARSFVLGKLGASFTYLFLLILTAVPIQSLAFLLGGVGLGEMLVSSLMLVVTALFLCALGLFFSSVMKRTLAATLSSYGAILLSIVLIVITFLLITYFNSEISDSEKTKAYLLTLLAWFFISSNPFLAAVASEIFLVEDQSLFLIKIPLLGSSSTEITLPSPWIIYVIFFVIFTLTLIYLSIRRVSRADR